MCGVENGTVPGGETEGGFLGPFISTLKGGKNSSPFGKGPVPKLVAKLISCNQSAKNNGLDRYPTCKSAFTAVFGRKCGLNCEMITDKRKLGNKIPSAIYLLVQETSARWPRGRIVMQITALLLFVQACWGSQVPFREKWFDQDVDHFDFYNAKQQRSTFKQKYLVQGEQISLCRPSFMSYEKHQMALCIFAALKFTVIHQ